MTARPPRGGELALPDLILSLKGDRTYKQLEADSGGVVKSQRWNQLANGERITEFPEPGTLKAMADALPCAIEVLLLAVARQVGLEAHGTRTGFVDLLPPSVDQLSAGSQSALLTMARSLTEAEAAAPPPKGKGRRRRQPRAGVQPL
ncbi:transcriptional repressor [Mycobacterium phage DS6A]|uniref:Uncharacterized protein n=1 Tax=Mycobacterium phage DS6A TaxID=45764 RepID=G8I4G8_9CAUD|nr:transcriptional repressor [Mycobacterium phage DS6A]AER47612.1 hypothetical protein DS6A_58 [Mycobacterium phage DS6A]